ncbi:MAG: pyridoxal-phosphate dependent enzyme [Ignavibacteriaceae bacterium]|nr:pyridoxal-phosphate dependent enzyme [Ignavibacteriaceae bacterium]
MINFKYPHKINIANIPSPIQKVTFNGKGFWIKRDDLTGLEMTGNKVRKLEFLLADAKRKKADLIFTCGGEQSNHARATAFAGKSLGFDVKLFLWGKDSPKADGNLFLNKVIRTDLEFITRKEYADVDQIMEQQKLQFEKLGRKVYIVKEGGSSELGVWGYVNAFQEILNQKGNNFNSILTASGSGGTNAGLLIGAHLFNKRIKIIGINVLYTAEYMRNRTLELVERTIKKFNLKIKLDEKLLEVIDGYSTEGYKNINHDKINIIRDFAGQTGILLDPAYTGKAFCAYNELFLNNNSKTLFIHTGGIFGAFAKKMNYLD